MPRSLLMVASLAALLLGIAVLLADSPAPPDLEQPGVGVQPDDAVNVGDAATATTGEG